MRLLDFVFQCVNCLIVVTKCVLATPLHSRIEPAFIKRISQDSSKKVPRNGFSMGIGVTMI